jgi:hypothetical protein
MLLLQLEHLQSLHRRITHATKFYVADDQLHIDTVYDSPLGVAGRHVLSRVWSGYSRGAVCRYLLSLVAECGHAVATVRAVLDSPYILNNYRLYATMTSSLKEAVRLSRSLQNSVAVFATITMNLEKVYSVGVVECTRSIGALLASIQTVVCPFNAKCAALNIGMESP